MTLRSEVAKDLFKEDIKDNFKRRITGGFWNTDPNYPYKPHIGVDYGANVGEELIAYDDYEVIGINTGHSDYGKHVYLYFPKIDKTGHYAHMDSISVFQGQKGKARDVIGTSGNTGKSSGPHLHFGFANGKVTNTNKGTEGNPWINFETYVYAPNEESKLVKQDGKFTVTFADGLNVRKEPSINSERVTGLSKGQSVIYDNYIDAEGYRWVSWLHEGTRVYGARRTLDNKEIYGTAEFLNQEPSKPVSDIGKSWTPKSVPLKLYPQSTGGTNYGNSNTKRTYKILDEANGRVQIQHKLFNAPQNKVWVVKPDGKVG